MSFFTPSPSSSTSYLSPQFPSPNPYSCSSHYYSYYYHFLNSAFHHRPPPPPPRHHYHRSHIIIFIQAFQDTLRSYLLEDTETHSWESHFFPIYPRRCIQSPTYSCITSRIPSVSLCRHYALTLGPKYKPERFIFLVENN